MKAATELVRIIGESAALKLMSELGGRCIHIPARAGRVHDELAPLLGHELAARLCSELGPGPLEVPRCAALLRGCRDAEIMQAVSAGESRASVARRYGLTVRRVGAIVRAMRAALPATA